MSPEVGTTTSSGYQRSSGAAAALRASGGLFAPDLERLLAPLAPDRPTGAALRYEGTYDRIREARREDDERLPQGVWQRPVKRADWGQVASLCAQALEHRTKDVQIAAWLADAWLRLHGPAGLHAGLGLLRQLCERYWDDLYPEIDDGDVEARVSPVEWMNDRLPLPLHQAPMTNPSTLNFPTSVWGVWAEALRQEHLKARGVASETDRTGARRTDIELSVAATPLPFFENMAGHLRGALAELDGLRVLLDAHCGAMAPGLGRLREEVATFGTWADGVVRGRRGPDAEPVETTSDAALAAGDEDMTTLTSAPSAPAEYAAPEGAAAPAAAGPIRTRADAYRQLAEAASFLMRVEPHSPTPYLVRRAISWGNMSLAELLTHFAESGHDLKSLTSLLGIGEMGKPK